MAPYKHQRDKQNNMFISLEFSRLGVNLLFNILLRQTRNPP